MASSTTGQHYHEYLDNICTYDLLLSLLQNSFLQTVKMHFRMRLGEPHGRKGLRKHESQRNHMRKSDFHMRALKPTACEKEKIRKKIKIPEIKKYTATIGDPPPSALQSRHCCPHPPVARSPSSSSLLATSMGVGGGSDPGGRVAPEIGWRAAATPDPAMALVRGRRWSHTEPRRAASLC